MYYRVAIQVDPFPTWQWRSTVLSSLNTLFHFLRLYRALPQDHLRVFSSCSREGMHEQLMRENTGLGSNSVTAAQFLQERGLRSAAMTLAEQSKHGTQESQGMKSIAVTTAPSLNERSIVASSLNEESKSVLERRRIELELGTGGNYDITYTFTLPLSLPQVLAWIKLLAKVQRGELRP